MFAVVNRLTQHQKRVATLLKQRANWQAAGVYLLSSMQATESALLNHLYVLTTHNEYPSLLGLDFKRMAQGDFYTFYNDQVHQALVQQALQQDELSVLQLCCLRLLTFSALDDHDLNHLGDDLGLTKLLLAYPATWQSNASAAQLNLALEQPERFSAEVKFFLFSRPCPRSYVHTALQHSDFDIVYGAFVNSYLNDYKIEEQTYFAAFARTEQAAQKASLLAVMGLMGNSQWHDVVFEFCVNAPQHCAWVLSHFQHKSALTLVIKLMQVAQCTQAAQQAWLNLTQHPLKQLPQLQAVNNSLCSSTHPAHQRPATDDAIYCQQRLLQTKGQWVWQGNSYDKNDAQSYLGHFGGLLTQRALCHSLPPHLGAWAFWQVSDSLTWKKVIA